MKKTRIIAVLLCAVLLMGTLVPLVNAAVIEIDIGNLFDPELGGGDSGDNGSGNNDTAGGDNGGIEGDGGNSNIPEYDDDPAPTTKPGSNQTSKDHTVGNKTEKEEPKEEIKEEPKPIVSEFSDVTKNDWFYDDVTALAKKGVVNGYDNGTFKPSGNVTRAEFIKLIVSLLVDEANMWESYNEVFDDVKSDAWYSDYIVTAWMTGLINPEEYGSNFKPDEAITRKEVAKIIVNAMSQILEFGYGTYKTPFDDTADHNAIALYKLCLMQGSFDANTGKRMFYPKTNITRAEVTAVINRISKLMENPNAYVESFKKSNPTYTELKLLYTPVTDADFYKNYENAWENSQAFLTFKYEYSYSGNEISEIKENAYRGFI